jgi:hypothetical protein
MFKNLDFKKNILPYLVAILAFFVVALVYCSPIFEGKVLNQMDTRKGAAMGQDMKDHQQRTGEKSLWTGSMFGGMPAYQISPSYKTFPFIRVKHIFEGWLPEPASYLFLFMIGFFILMCAFGVNPWIGMVGAIAYALSSNFLIFIIAGHIWKVWVLGLIPPTFAGIVWAYQGKFMKGAAVFGLFLTLQLLANHIQMTYYFFVFVGLIYLAYVLIKALKDKEMLNFSKATGALLIAGILAIGVNATNLIFTAEYAKDTIRGKSELSANPGNKTSGLDKSYATDWSYGKVETFSLLVPNIKGGGNAAIGNEDRILKHVDSSMKQTIAQNDRYWGDQPFTAGPVYVGAFVLFLFIFGLFAVKNSIKWALLAGTILSILLAWGKNFMPMTDLFMDYFPMYNKFRSVSTILIVAELCIPILAALCLAEIVRNPKIIQERIKGFWISFALTGGLALLFWLLPKMFFTFYSDNETTQFAQWMQQNPSASGQISLFIAGLESARVAILKADALRSFLIIAFGIAALWLFQKEKIKKSLLIGGIMLLILVDLWTVDKRYFNNESFVPKREAVVAWPMTDADRLILNDKDLGYRVFNLTVSPFQDGSTSYYHRSVGGYHAAKLRRYQDVIDHYFSTNINLPILNMLNTRYIIVPDQNKQPMVQRNPDALGAAWFVDSYRLVNNADEEIAAIGNFNPAHEAIVDKRFGEQLANRTFSKDSLNSSIRLVSYEPDHLTYEYTASKDQLAVFSEIYYADGWVARVDGKEVPIFRANYLLRAAVVPVGKHTIDFKFEPKKFVQIENLSMIALIALILFIGGIFGLDLFKKKKIKSIE